MAFNLSEFSKKYGKETVQQGIGNIRGISSTPTGSYKLDKISGIGGYPKGRFVEIFGPEHSGKTTMAIHAMAEAQKAGGMVAFIDVEHSLDLTYAKTIGVDVDNLVVVFPENAENAFDIAIDLVNSKEFSLITLDSVAALVPKAELEGEMGDSQIGLQARIIGKGVRKLTAALHSTDTSFILINQLRLKVGVVFGNPETRPGGKSLDYAASMMLEIRRGTPIKDGENIIGYNTNVKVTKNKVGGMPGAAFDFAIMWGKGIDRMGELLDVAESTGVVEKTGAWYAFAGERIGQGKQNTIEYLGNNPEVVAKIVKGMK